MGSPNLGNMDQENNVQVLAASLVFARTGDPTYRLKVFDQLKAAIGTEGGSALALAREAGAYALAADFIVLRELDPAWDANVFRPWLRSLLTKTIEDRTLRSTHEERANNWGTHAGASRAAIAAYLGDLAELERAATVFRGWLGDRNAYAGFSWGDLSWQCDPNRPVGINPKGCTKNGLSIDGVLPDDQRRGGSFNGTPTKENYVYEGLQGALVYNPGDAQDRGRAVTALADDRVVFAGAATVAGTNKDAMLLLVEKDGAPARNFDADVHKGGVRKIHRQIAILPHQLFHARNISYG